MIPKSFRALMALGPALAIATSGAAQLLPGNIGTLPGQVIGGVLQPAVDGIVPGAAAPAAAIASNLDGMRLTEGLDRATLLDLRRQRLRALVRDNRAVLDMDDDGNPVRKREVMAIDASPGLIARAEAAGFTLLREDTVDGLDLRVAVFAPPRGKDAADGIKLLRKLQPDGRFALNHVFEPAGAALMATAGLHAGSGSTSGGGIGMVDGGVAAHPAFSHASIEQRGFTSNGARPSGHGTAIASLLVGADGRFVGAARGQKLLVADVYGGQPAAGSAEAIVRGLGWLATRRVRVVTISLVGPPNALLERAMAVLRTRGMIVVAAVGNDGPAAPPQYPASYPGVIAVTAVDARDRALTEAGRATHLDFAAPGADMAAALPGKGYAVVRGTSFAAPLVAARLAMTTGIGAVEAEALPGKGRVGRGIICKTCRIDPKAVDARR